MEFQRSSGVLLHVSSLPSRGGIGDMGPAAHEFLEFLAAGKQHLWQVLPLCPTGFGNSPYAGTSAFAGNPLLISLDVLADWGWIARDRVDALNGAEGNVVFDKVTNQKLPLLYEAAASFLDRAQSDAKLATQWEKYGEFCRAQTDWLDDYALYAELRRQFKTGAWTAWPEPLKKREPDAIREAVQRSDRALATERVLQFAFAEQWDALRAEAAKHSIRFLGDIAIFVNMDSADVWVHPDIFELDEDLNPIHIAGVPPDYFSPTGQRWGNPLYRWDVLAERGFDWWIKRVRHACELYDIVRLDHFRGFEAYWSIPAAEETAINGKWIKAPGLELFQALEAALGPLPLVAEDLGMITEEVNVLRDEAGFPGMKVMQFGFGNKGAHLHLPHRVVPKTVLYTGTHDNDTTQGWWNAASDTEHQALEAYVGQIDGHAAWPMMRSVFASVAQVAVVPAQDLLELGSEARMNTPAVPAGNWAWRAGQGSWKPEIAERLAALTLVTDRENDPMGDGSKERESS